MNKVMIIAEAGVNHNGDVNMARELIDVAALAGVDYVKFQTFSADKIVDNVAKMADYQQNNLNNSDETQYAMLKKLELSEQMHIQILAHCKKKGVNFLSTPFDIDSIIFLKKLGITVGKIPSGEITNLPYLKKMAETFPDLIISTGMCTMSEIRDAINVLIAAGAKKDNMTILHCNTEYPTPMHDVNLKAMLSIANKFKISIGYSDHTMGIEVPIAATALGAVVIEKHFTLDRNLDGPDHVASLEPNELIEMVKCIRNIEVALGTGLKKPSNSEKKNINIIRKSIIASRDIVKGEVLTEENLTVKRPGTGISPMKWDYVIGSTAKRDYKYNDFICL